MNDELNGISLEVCPRNGRESRQILIHHNGRRFADRVVVESCESVKRCFSRAAKVLQLEAETLMQGLYDRLLKEAERVDAEANNTAEALAAQQANWGWEPSGTAREEAARLLESPRLLAEVVDAVQQFGVVGERPLVALAYLVATSRLLEKPLYLLLQGPPATGKSFIANAIAEMLPPKLVMSITDATANSLYYLNDPTALKDKLLLLGERKRQLAEEAIDQTKALRELVEAGKLSKLIPVKTPDGPQTILIELEGAPAIIETCAHNAIGQEDISRMIVAWPDESEEQTRRVLQAMAERKAHAQEALAEDRLEVIRAIQTMLDATSVTIPFLPELAQKFPATTPEARRVFTRWVGLIEASALLHQRQRDIANGKLIAEEDEALLAWKLVSPWVKNRLVEAPPPAVLKVWEAIKGRGKVLQSELVNSGVASRPSIRKAITYLERQDAIEVFDSGKTKEVVVKNPAWEPADFDLFDGEHTF